MRNAKRLVMKKQVRMNKQTSLSDDFRFAF